MELDITRFFHEAAHRDYSASVAELGPTAGQDTWRAACDDVEDWNFLDTPEKIESFRSFLGNLGGWTDAEISAMPDAEIQALCIQWIAGDIRECSLGKDSFDWDEYESMALEGIVPSSLYRDPNANRIYWSGE